jgi:ABC-type glycerol-3-phosphate transport system permease component
MILASRIRQIRWLRRLGARTPFQSRRSSVVMSFLMVVGAICASLAFGVLAAYGICKLLFRIFWMHASSVAVGGETSSVGIRN